MSTRKVVIGQFCVEFVLVNAGSFREPNYLWTCGSCGVPVPSVTEELHARWHIERR